MLPDELIDNIYYFSLIQKPYCSELKSLVNEYIKNLVNEIEEEYPIFIDVDMDFTLSNKNIIQGICFNLGFDIAFAQNLVNYECFFVIDRDIALLN